jgi:cysteine desulfurase
MSLIYLDYNSTTPVDENVLATMLPYFSEQFGNAASATHRFGWQAQGAIEKARIQTASLLNAEPSEIIFTSGATESINLALRGAAEIYRVNGNHIISVSTEHKAVLDTLNDLSNHGFSVSYLSVDRSGRINIDELTSLIKKETILVSIMMANNETGVLQDVEAIGKICH